MNPFRYRAVAEADHNIQNPTSPEKMRRLIDYLRLADGDRILDVGCGKGWLLRTLAAEWRVDVVGLEINRFFAAEARRALAEVDLVGAATIVEGPALDYAAEGQFDAALCIGASFALGDFESALDWLAKAIRPGGRIAIGEPFARRLPLPDPVRERWPEFQRDLVGTAEILTSHGLQLTGLIAASQDDWDHYEGQHWAAAAAWDHANPGDPDAGWLAAKIETDRAAYLNHEREAFGWAIFVAERTRPFVPAG